MQKMDKRITKTKAAIHKAFIELIAEQDLDKITINDIAEKADINRGTIYLHYTDKFDLFNQCAEEHLNDIFKFCNFIKPMEERIDIFQSLLLLFQHFEENYLFYSSMMNNKSIFYFHDQMLQISIRGISERMKKEHINKEFDKEFVVQFIASAFVGVVEWWIKNTMPHSPQFMAQQLWNTFKSSQFLSL